jgi:hypothetical protein
VNPLLRLSPGAIGTEPCGIFLTLWWIRLSREASKLRGTIFLCPTVLFPYKKAQALV